MRSLALVVPAALLALHAGCATADPSAATAASAPSSTAGVAPRTATPIPTTSPTTPTARTGPAEQLPAYRVQEWAFNDFGLSVKTNFEVTLGEKIQWMEVSAVDPTGAAHQARIAVGDRILALGSTLVAELDRTALVDTLFQRKRGDLVRLLVLGRGQGLPRFVTLQASRP